MIGIELPSSVQAVLDRLESAGFEAYAVGGCVRDCLLGTAPHDWDVTTAATPEQTLAVFADTPVAKPGLAHGTVLVRMQHEPIEVTTFRLDAAYSDHRHPDEVTFSTKLEDDLSRRDFTVNAMAYHPARGLVDRFGGQEDLARRIIRCVGDPKVRFAEDALRILRALRFASQLDFEIEPATADAARDARKTLSHVSAERLYAEMTRLLIGPGAGRVLRQFPEIVFEVCPVLADSFRFDQHSRHHIYDVYEHIARTVDAAPADPVLRWAMLLHDAGKPACFTRDEHGEGHFYGHPAVSARLADETLQTLKADRATRERLVELVSLHDRQWACTLPSVKRLLAKLGEPVLRQLLAVQRADRAGCRPDGHAENEAHEAKTLHLLQTILDSDACFQLRDLAIDGNDWLAAGLPDGPAVGQGLQKLLDAVTDGTLPNEKAALLKAARAWYA